MFKRIFAIHRAHMEEPLNVHRALPIFVLAAAMMVLNWLGTSWKGDDLYWLGFDLKGYNEQFDHTPSLTANAFFCERLWYVWLVVTLFYWVPAVLLPLSRSFTQSGTHWIRLTNAGPLEALLGRATPAFIVAAGLLVANSLWMMLVIFTRGGQAPVLAVAPVGMFAYYVFTIACVIHPTVRAIGNHQSALVVMIAVLSPILLWISAFMFRSNAGTPQWWPYVLPFQGYLDEAFWKHLASLMVGACLLFASAAFLVGRRILPDSTSLSTGVDK